MVHGQALQKADPFSDSILEVEISVHGFGGHGLHIIANPGEGIVQDPQEDGLIFPKPVRDYDALEFTFDKRFADNWSLRAYYTLSRTYGNYSGLANSDEMKISVEDVPRVGGGGFRSAPIQYNVRGADLPTLVDLADRDRAAGLPDAPWPPQYPKMPGEETRVAPSRARREAASRIS